MSVEAFIGRIFKVGRLGQGAVLGSIGLGTRAVIQALYLILLSRWMGAAPYGVLAGSIAMATVLAPLSGWGVSMIATRTIASQHGTASAMWASAIAQITLTGAVLLCLFVAGSIFLPEHVDWLPMCLLGVSELWLIPMAQAGTSVCYALDRSIEAAIAMCLAPAMRVLAALGLILCHVSGSADHVALSHFAGSLIGVVLLVMLLAPVAGRPAFSQRRASARLLADGSAYAVGALVNTSYQEIDKVVMLQLIGATSVGAYTAAFRVASVAVLPISALISSAIPRLFAAAGDNRFGKTLRAVTFAATGYGLLASIVLVLVAPLLPHLFGAGFAQATKLLYFLAPWPLLFALHQCTAMGLTAAGKQRVRVAVEGAGLAVIVVLNLLLLPRLGAPASALALLTTEIAIAIACAMFLRTGGEARSSRAG